MYIRGRIRIRSRKLNGKEVLSSSRLSSRRNFVSSFLILILIMTHFQINVVHRLSFQYLTSLESHILLLSSFKRLCCKTSSLPLFLVFPTLHLISVSVFYYHWIFWKRSADVMWRRCLWVGVSCCLFHHYSQKTLFRCYLDFVMLLTHSPWNETEDPEVIWWKWKKKKAKSLQNGITCTDKNENNRRRKKETNEKKYSRKEKPRFILCLRL